MLRLPILTLVAAATLVAGCGGGGDTGAEGGVPPGDWAESVCGALSAWQTSLEQQGQALSGTVLEAESPQAAKDEIGSFLDGVIAETDTMIGEVRSAGTPDVQEGDRIAEDLNNGLRQLRSAFDDARQQVETVPTDDPQAFQQALTDIGGELETQGTAIGNTLEDIDEKYDAEELTQAFDETPACEEFVQQSG